LRFKLEILLFNSNRKVDTNGQFVNRESREYEGRIPNKFITKIKRGDAESASLKVTPQVVDNGGNVNVVWSGVENPSAEDYVALYCPGNDKPQHYLDYFNVNVDAHFADGTGMHEVRVFNMRSTCLFKYFRHNGDAAQLVAISNTVSFVNGPLAILQVHLALTNDPSQMRVMWVSAKCT